ncbi:hypothetical protein BDV33DRAFT_183968 [Aspergillus novoparasiticus]|uniref:Uncharacterized protein n=1 Tax=Aspergillus novoparasiticus TaxID=986946 RepID=A0A5N6E890_9EURO|nr:hypothetical protein BDV33DRAFT_183968 [Aspergillus novoparasiticus]
MPKGQLALQVDNTDILTASQRLHSAHRKCQIALPPSLSKPSQNQRLDQLRAPPETGSLGWWTTDVEQTWICSCVQEASAWSILAVGSHGWDWDVMDYRV